MNKLVLIALGGNALGLKVEDQKRLVKETVENIIPIIKDGYDVIITHGNGPQVGLINLAFTEASKVNEKIEDFPFPECGAMSEGYIGYHLQNAMNNALREENINKQVASIVTQVLVDKNDPAFSNPTKPIGAFYTYEESLTKPYPMKEDSGRGYRRVIASPKPVSIIEEDIIKDLIDKHHIVITVGGGGIPVIKDNNKLVGIDAVIDKDLASSLLAKNLKADYFLILTAVDKVAINFNKPNQKNLDTLTYNDALEYIKNGEFGKGSMLPKVEACLNFVCDTGNTAIITSIKNAYSSLKSNAGTKIIK